VKSPLISVAACITLLALAGCGKQSASVPAPVPPPGPDPWQAKLDAWQKEYESNEAKLLADWPVALKQAKAGDVDASKLSNEIDDFDRELIAQREKLEGWNRELIDELRRRGLMQTGKPGVL
jgi:hypothetical protein